MLCCVYRLQASKQTRKIQSLGFTLWFLEEEKVKEKVFSSFVFSVPVGMQDLQRDIEQHTESVASVLTLCDVLLHDADACGSDSENDSIQQTTLSLDRRWRNICAMSMERRMRWAARKGWRLCTDSLVYSGWGVLHLPELGLLWLEVNMCLFYLQNWGNVASLV